MTIDAGQPTLELHTQQFIDGLAGAPPIYSLSPDEARSVLCKYSRYRLASQAPRLRIPPSRLVQLDRCRYGSFARPASSMSCRR
jgi:hypothetical protein